MRRESREMRTNAPYPIVLNSARSQRLGATSRPNIILQYFRDNYGGEESVLELLWASQVLRHAYDSERIGGGIDPEIAQLGASSLSSEREEEGSFINYLAGTVAEAGEHLQRKMSIALIAGADEKKIAEFADALGNLDDYVPAFDGLTNEEIQDQIVHAEAVALRLLRFFENNR